MYEDQFRESKNNNGNDVSDWFNITTDNNNVVAALKDPQGNAIFIITLLIRWMLM